MAAMRVSGADVDAAVTPLVLHEPWAVRLLRQCHAVLVPAQRQHPSTVQWRRSTPRAGCTCGVSSLSSPRLCPLSSTARRLRRSATALRAQCCDRDGRAQTTGVRPGSLFVRAMPCLVCCCSRCRVSNALPLANAYKHWLKSQREREHERGCRHWNRTRPGSTSRAAILVQQLGEANQENERRGRDALLPSYEARRILLPSPLPSHGPTIRASRSDRPSRKCWTLARPRPSQGREPRPVAGSERSGEP